MGSLVGKPLEFYSCFISYSSKDQEFAERPHADLRSKKVRCWFAPEDMKTGDRIRDRIDQTIRLYEKLLLILSGNSIQSDWVETEVETALEEESRRKAKLPADSPRPSVLFPIRLDDAVTKSTMPWARKIRRERHITDFTQWKHHDAYQKTLARLLRDLKAGEKAAAGAADSA